jgi:hypothetical protein
MRTLLPVVRSRLRIWAVDDVAGEYRQRRQVFVHDGLELLAARLFRPRPITGIPVFPTTPHNFFRPTCGPREWIGILAETILTPRKALIHSGD